MGKTVVLGQNPITLYLVFGKTPLFRALAMKKWENRPKTTVS